jgi:predicted nucleotidyltransferase
VDNELWQSVRWTKDIVITALRAHELELKAAGIVHLHLHGSVVRGEARAGFRH